ncbi:MAG: M20 family metallopeptidase [Clostridiales bacterium]|nr:M20 family metallopeptidase [Clostridiales bacterium]
MLTSTDFIENLSTLISYKTVLGKEQPGAPFGIENKKALDFFLSLAKSFGFETINHEGYAGEIIFGEGEEIGIIGHLDVVPTGLGWQSDPFSLVFKDGFYYGRGLVDDKGPTLMCLYALKELKDSCLAVNKKFRLFVGCNEEKGWNDLKYLTKKTTLPEYGFSPDGNFPVSYAEKGVLNATFTLPKLKNFYNLSAGTAINVVCDYASVYATQDGINHQLLEKHGLSLKDGNLIESFGKAAHSSTPDLGVNAIKPLFEYFLDMGENVKNAVDYLFNDKSGFAKMQNEQGTVTIAPTIAFSEQDKTVVRVNFRVPAPFTANDICKKMDTFGYPYEYVESHVPVMVEKDGWFVNTMLKSFSAVTKMPAKPISMGGSTFARAFKKGCAFGPDFLTYSTNIHDANERVSLKDLEKAYSIYKTAIFEFAK